MNMTPRVISSTLVNLRDLSNWIWSKFMISESIAYNVSFFRLNRGWNLDFFMGIVIHHSNPQTCFWFNFHVQSSNLKWWKNGKWSNVICVMLAQNFDTLYILNHFLLCIHAQISLISHVIHGRKNDTFLSLFFNNMFWLDFGASVSSQCCPILIEKTPLVKKRCSASAQIANEYNKCAVLLTSSCDVSGWSTFRYALQWLLDRHQI